MRVFTLLLSLLLPILDAASVKADYPDRPVHIIVPVAAGGGVDVMARMLAQKLSESWNQQFIVENRPGAAGIIGRAKRLGLPERVSLGAAVDVLRDFPAAQCGARRYGRN